MQEAKDREATGKLVVPKSNGVVAQTSLPESDEGMVEATAPESNGVVAKIPLPEASVSKRNAIPRRPASASREPTSLPEASVSKRDVISIQDAGELVVPKSNGVVAQKPLPEASVPKRDVISVQATGELVVPKSNGVVAQKPLPEADKGAVKTTPPEPNGAVAQTPLPEAEEPVVQIPYQIPVNSVSMAAGNPVWGTGNQGAASPWQGLGGLPQTPSPQPGLKSAPASGTAVVHSKQTSQVSRVRSKSVSKRDVMSAQALRERCRQLCLSVFFREQAPARSLGFTSSLAGEGKTFLAMVTADVLARDSSRPVTLLECNWEHPCLHEHFGFSATPGLAEWLRGECHQTAICHRVNHNLTVIPAGDARWDAVKLLQQVRQKGLLGTSNGLWIVDLPAIVSTAYGSLAASIVESLVVVVHAGVTPDSMIAEACAQLKDLPVQGILLNQLESRIPRWIRRLL